MNSENFTRIYRSVQGDSIALRELLLWLPGNNENSERLLVSNEGNEWFASAEESIEYVMRNVCKS
jgi:hypothetical protein